MDILYKKEIIVFGLGNGFKKFEESVLKKYRVVAFLDNKVKKTPVDGIPIFSINEFNFDLFMVPIYISSNKYWKEMSKQLYDIGISEKWVVNGEALWSQEKRKEELIGNKMALNISNMPLVPFKKDFGLERGTSIDRVLIERFINENRSLIRGDCIEIAENTYTMKYGANIKRARIMHVDGGEGVIKGNLVTGEGIESNSTDCAIITQTLMFLNDVTNVAESIYTLLRNGGNAIITVSGISQISRFDADRWGHFCSFYPDGLRALFREKFGEKNVKIQSFGNVKLCMGFLYGMCAEDFSEKDFDYCDCDYPLIVGCILHKG